MGKDVTPHTLKAGLGSDLLSSLGASIAHISTTGHVLVRLASPSEVMNTQQPLPNAQLRRLAAF